MVPAAIDLHVDPLDHVTAFTLSGLGTGFMEVVSGGVVVCPLQGWKIRIARWRMALGADCVPFGDQLRRVNVMAVAAADAPSVHLGLKERAVDINFVQNGPVRVVEPVAQQCQAISIVIWRTGQRVAAAKRLAPRMAACAELSLGFRGGAEPNGKTPRGQRRPASRVIASVICPGEMRLARAMAALAADADFRLRTLIPPGLRGVVFHEAGGMTLRATRVPVLVGPGPMQAVIRPELLIGIQMNPAFLFHIPGYIERLKLPPISFKQDLLQRCNPSYRMHFVGPGHTVLLGHGNPIFAIFRCEPAQCAALRMFGVFEIPKDRIIPRFGPGQRMVRGLPGPHDVAMTLDTGLCPDIIRMGWFDLRK